LHILKYISINVQQETVIQ